MVVTTPTGDTSSQVLCGLLDRIDEALRVVVRGPARLPDTVHDRLDAVTGPHGDPSVLDPAFAGAAVSWSPTSESTHPQPRDV